MRSINQAKYYIAIFSAVFIWSSAFIVTKVALTGIGPITLSAIRIMIAFIIMLPVALKRGFRFKALFSKNAFLYGIFGYGGNLALLSVGLVSCTANISAVIHGLFPVFMILFGYTMLNESITRSKILGIAFSVAGVIIASAGDLSQNSETTLPGILLVAASVLTWAYYSVYSKKTEAGTDTFILSEICFGAGFLCLLPFAIFEQLFTDVAMPNSNTILSLVYLGVMSGGLGIVLWNYGLKKIDPSVAGIYFNLMPVIGLFLAVFVHERIALFQVFGCFLILTGVFVCARPKRSKQNTTSN